MRAADTGAIPPNSVATIDRDAVVEAAAGRS
jgi:hypothetical protein